MKKILSFLSFLLAFNFVFAQQTKQNNYSTFGSHPFSSTQAKYKTAMLPPVPTTTTSSCMSINLPTPTTWSLTNYGTGTPIFTNGFVNGPNTYGDKEKAMYFDVSASANTMITQVYVGFDIAYSATPSKTVAVRIYDGTGGTVGAALGTSTITMGTIMSDVAANRYSVVFFPTPINLPVSKKFFASVDVSGLQWPAAGAKDSLSIVSNTSPQTTPTPTWEKQSNNTWYNYADAVNSWSLNISLLIHPFLTQAPVVATYSTSGSTICAGQSVSYNSAGSTAGTYQWSFGAISTPTASGATPVATYTAAGTYTTLLIASDACGSLAAAQGTITVKPNPTVSATPSSTTICSGKNITLTGGGASSYVWTGGVTNGVSFTPAASLNYSVTGTAANGCTSTAVASVVVNPTPTVTANTSTNTVCAGSNITLTGGGATSYAWTGGAVNGTPFAPSSTNTYTVTGTSGSCTNTAVVTVTVNNLPNVSATPSSTTVCSGGSVSLSGSGAISYAWSGGISNGVSFIPSGTLNYTVTGTATNGCTNTAVVPVVVNPTPTVTANASALTVCPGSTLVLTGSGASSYAWTGGVTDGTSFIPSATDTYTVTGTSGSCSNTAVITVTVNNSLVVTANASSNSICAGSNVTLTGGGASSYVWTGGVSDGIAFAPTSTDTYTVIGTAGSCSNTAVVSVTVNSLPMVTANTSTTSICTGANVTLTGGGASSYVWTGGVTDGVSFVPTSTDTYTVVGTVGSCSNTAVVSVTVNSLPVVSANTTASTVCTGNSVTLSGSGATSYVWTNSVTNGTSFIPSSTNVYTVTGTDANGCAGTATIQVVVSPCTGIEEMNFSSSFALYPNPNNGEFTIQSQKADIIVISNELGQVIETVELNQSNNFSRKVTSLSSGIYFLVGKQVKQKVIVTN